MGQQHLIVIGGGAAGFFCAVNAARLNPQLKVTIVEKNNKVLSKVKVSGGGRCNVTHACFDIGELVKYYPRGVNFLKKAFHWFNTNHTVQWFNDRGVQLKREEDGRMFPVTDSSQTIIDCLLREANKYKVEVLFQTDVKAITCIDGIFKVNTGAAAPLTADYLCIACGGYPKASQFDWLTQIGHTIEAPVPSLFTFNMPGNNITQLMGVSVESATVKIAGTKLQQTGPLLITHWGLSGPAVLKLSAWAARELAACDYKFSIVINWLPAFNEHSLKDEILFIRSRDASLKISGRNAFGLPSRLWQYFMELCEIKPDWRWADLPGRHQQKLIQALTAQLFLVSGKTTFKEEFVTCGGVTISEIDPQTLQSRIVPGIYFAGEILDVDGITGGYNFQHAWSSAWIAAQNMILP